MRDSADVVVVGGGIVGAAAAYYLARRGLDVVLLEKGRIAGEQSSRNWGWVRQNGRNLREIPLAVASRAIWAALADELGEDVGWVSAGNVDLAYDEAELATFRAWREGARKHGLQTEVLDRRQVLDLVPGIDDAFIGGIYSPLDGQADPHLAAPALARAAARHGAELCTDTAVEAIEVDGDAVTGVRTEHGAVRAPVVVAAAGAWTSRLLWPLGLRLPQRKIRSTVLATTPAAPLTDVVVWAEGLALRQARDGRFILAGGAPGHYDLDLETVRFLPRFWRSMLDARRRGRARYHLGRPLLRDLRASLPGTLRAGLWPEVRNEEPAPDVDGAWRTFERFRSLFPAIEGVGVDRIWAGYIDYTPDAVPVIDRPGPRGLVVATGFSGHGFALGPIGGLLAAELAAGDEPTVDVHPFRLARFADRDTAEHELHF